MGFKSDRVAIESTIVFLSARRAHETGQEWDGICSSEESSWVESRKLILNTNHLGSDSNSTHCTCDTCGDCVELHAGRYFVLLDEGRRKKRKASLCFVVSPAFYLIRKTQNASDFKCKRKKYLQRMVNGFLHRRRAAMKWKSSRERVERLKGKENSARDLCVWAVEGGRAQDSCHVLEQYTFI